MKKSQGITWTLKMASYGAILGIAMFWIGTTGASAETLNIGGNVMPPWSMEDGPDGAGINVDIVREAAKRAGYDTTYKVVPFKRKLEDFRQQAIDVDPGSNPQWRTDDKDISVYSIPFYESFNVVLVRKDSGISAETVQDLKGKRIGCLAGYNYTDGFHEAFASGDLLRDDANAHESNVKKLNAKRVDGVIIDQETAGYIIKELGLNPEDFTPAYAFQTKSVLHIRLHKSKEALLPKLDAALQAMKDDGTIQRIVEKYTK